MLTKQKARQNKLELVGETVCGSADNRPTFATKYMSDTEYWLHRKGWYINVYAYLAKLIAELTAPSTVIFATNECGV